MGETINTGNEAIIESLAECNVKREEELLKYITEFIESLAECNVKSVFLSPFPPPA